jgi:hypothetical protein
MRSTYVDLLGSETKLVRGREYRTRVIEGAKATRSSSCTAAAGTPSAGPGT